MFAPKESDVGPGVELSGVGPRLLLSCLTSRITGLHIRFALIVEDLEWQH